MIKPINMLEACGDCFTLEDLVKQIALKQDEIIAEINYLESKEKLKELLEDEELLNESSKT